MKKYSYIKAIFLSFFSEDLYKDVANNWQGSGLKYLFILMLLISIIFTFVIYNKVNNFDVFVVSKRISQLLYSDKSLSFEENLNRTLNVVAQIPNLELRDGKIFIENDDNVTQISPRRPETTYHLKPIHVIDPDSRLSLAIFDTSGIFRTLLNSPASLLVTRHNIVTKKTDGEDNIFELSHFKNAKDLENNLNDILYVIGRIPLITINGGISTMEEESPYIIKDRLGEKDIAIFDTSGNYNNLDDTDALFLMTNTAIFLKNPKDQQINKMFLTELDYEFFDNLLNNISTILKGVIIPSATISMAILFLLLSYSSVILTLLLFSVLGIVFVNILNAKNVNFQKLVRISAVSLTPTIILHFFLPKIILHQEIIYFLIAIGYLFYGIRSNIESSDVKQ